MECSKTNINDSPAKHIDQIMDDWKECTTWLGSMLQRE